ncbi:MAG: hypothetical protein KDN20_12575, partial [Verrucomicrobiae bacterium]|nr:hypothetical protein [Verrucomicrobiae bacterium]
TIGLHAIAAGKGIQSIRDASGLRGIFHGSGMIKRLKRTYLRMQWNDESCRSLFVINLPSLFKIRRKIAMAFSSQSLHWTAASPKPASWWIF